MERTLPVARSVSSTIKLNDDVEIPLFGLGTYAAGPETERAVSFALENGYRLIDTAQFYENESSVGRAVKTSNVDRQHVFVVSKVWNDFHGYSRTLKSVYESLARFELSYVDMFLIHSPGGGKLVETYRALLDLKNKGLIRSVGVSNFGIQHLEGLASSELPAPSVNQIQLHPFQRNDGIVKYCQVNGIAVMGYSPLVQARQMSDPDLTHIALTHQKSVSQILLKWSLQNGYITIPKSTNKDRILHNANIFDFELTAEDLEKLKSKPEKSISSFWNPTDMPWEG